MVNAHVAFERNRQRLLKKGVRCEADLQYIVYTQNFTRPVTPGAGDVGAVASQSFPANCTLVLGIQGDATPDTQPNNPFLIGNERYRCSFQYNANSIGLVTPFGQQGALAITIFGRFEDQFPARELYLEANDTIAQTIQNVTPEAITGTIAYHCLIWKYAQ